MRSALLCFFLFPLCLTAQRGFVLPQTENTRRIDLAVSANGDRIVLGEVWYRGTPSIDLDPGEETFRFPELGEDAGFGTFIASYNPAGELNFAIPISDPNVPYNNVEGHYVDTDADGNIYVKGNFLQSADFDPTDAVFRVSTPSGRGYYSYLASYTATGVLRYAFGLPLNEPFKTNLEDRRQFGVDAAGNSYALFFPSHEADFDPGPDEFLLPGARSVVVSYDRNGQFRFGFSTLEEAQSLGVAPNGEFYVLGPFDIGDEDYDLDPGEGVYTQGFEPDPVTYMLLAFTAGQDLNFAQGFRGDVIHPYFVDGDADGNVYLGGTLAPGSVDVAPGSAVYELSNFVFGEDRRNIFLVKYAADGTVRRGFYLEDSGSFVTRDQVYDHALTADGRLYLTGYLEYGEVDFDPDPERVAPVGNTSGQKRGFVAAYEGDLDLTFAYSIEGTEGDGVDVVGPFLQIAATEYCGDYALLLNANLPVTTDFDPGEGTLSPSATAGDTESVGLVVLSQYAPGTAPATDATCEVISSVARGSHVLPAQASPNPSASGSFVLQLPFEITTEDRYLVTDVAGRTVQTRSGFRAGARMTVDVDLRGKPAGVYFLRYTSGDKVATARLLIQE